jgi:hypothetical protein
MRPVEGGTYSNEKSQEQYNLLLTFFVLYALWPEPASPASSGIAFALLL